MKVLSTGGLSPKTEIKAKCNNCKSELLGTLSEFSGRVKSDITQKFEIYLQTNMDWWCDNLGLTHILDVIPNIEAIREDQKNLDKLQDDLLGLLIETNFKSGLVIFPEEDFKRIKLYTKCPVCGNEVDAYIDNYTKLNITSPYTDGEKPFMVKLQKCYGKYTQTIEVEPVNQTVIQYILKHGFKVSE